jgi:hypothetical protein
MNAPQVASPRLVIPWELIRGEIIETGFGQSAWIFCRAALSEIAWPSVGSGEGDVRSPHI